jgi:DNA-binding beta-propeller fold protein YncE
MPFSVGGTPFNYVFDRLWPRLQQPWYFATPYGVAVDASGNVIVADTYASRIQVLNSSGTFLRKWGSSGSGDGQFNTPRGVVVDTSGNVIVADTGNNRIQVFNSSGTFLRKWGSSGWADGQFSQPYGVAVDASGNVIVTDVRLALHVPHKLIHSNKIDWFIAEQYSSQCNILEALEPT